MTRRQRHSRTINKTFESFNGKALRVQVVDLVAMAGGRFPDERITAVTLAALKGFYRALKENNLPICGTCETEFKRNGPYPLAVAMVFPEMDDGRTTGVSLYLCPACRDRPANRTMELILGKLSRTALEFRILPAENFMADLEGNA